MNINEGLNLVGVSTGVVLYAMLLVMVLRTRDSQGREVNIDPLLLLTSLSGLVWNLCALVIYELPRLGVRGPFAALNVVGFSALGLLPAVVVHSVLRREGRPVQGPAGSGVVLVAYTVSTASALLHAAAAWGGRPVPSALGMRLLTYTFVALVVPLATMTRGQPGARRALWAASLAIFAVSALHLSQLHQGEASWPVELVGHHASLPLAFAILYQDYPFAFADLFLKRALALLAIVTLTFLALTTFATASSAFARLLQVEPSLVTVLVTFCVGAALLYPWLQRLTAWFVDAIVLRRPDYESVRRTLAGLLAQQEDAATLLSEACAVLQPALSATFVVWRPLTGGEEVMPPGSAVVSAVNVVTPLVGSDDPPPGPVTHVVLVPTTDPARFLLLVGPLTGGRRFLSDDLAMLESAAIGLARRIDAMRLTTERYGRTIREHEMSKLATEAELRALRAQINPHFLFNALTTIGYLIQTRPSRALHTLLRLTAVLRGVLRSEGESTTLGREIEVIEAYLDIERARFEDRLRVIIDVPVALRSLPLPPLLLQPLVENAVKHGIAQMPGGGEVRVRATLAGSPATPGHLRLTVEDTGAGASAHVLARGREAGIGLRNVARRLECQFGATASLTVESEAGRGTRVRVDLPLTPHEMSREALQRGVS